MLGRRRATRREVDTDALGVHGDGLADGEGGGRGGGRAGSDSCGVNGGEVEVDVSLGTFFEVPDDGREGSCNILRIKVGIAPVFIWDTFFVGGSSLLCIRFVVLTSLLLLCCCCCCCCTLLQLPKCKKCLYSNNTPSTMQPSQIVFAMHIFICVLDGQGEATPGQILMLYNGDADPTSGVAIIPPG